MRPFDIIEDENSKESSLFEGSKTEENERTDICKSILSPSSPTCSVLIFCDDFIVYQKE